MLSVNRALSMLAVNNPTPHGALSAHGGQRRRLHERHCRERDERSMGPNEVARETSSDG
jgi:hypothetical protein